MGTNKDWGLNIDCPRCGRQHWIAPKPLRNLMRCEHVELNFWTTCLYTNEPILLSIETEAY